MKQSAIVLTILLFACQPGDKLPPFHYSAKTPDYYIHEKMIYDWGADTIGDIKCVLYRHEDHHLSVRINDTLLRVTDTIGEVKPESLLTFRYNNKRYLLIRLTRYEGCLADEVNSLLIDPERMNYWMRYSTGPVYPFEELLDGIK